MKKIVTLISIAICSLSIIFITKELTTDRTQNDTKKNYSSKLTQCNTRQKQSGMISTSEVYCSNEEIIAMSCLIVKGKLTKLLGSYDYVCVSSESGEEIITTRYLYEFVPSETWKGESPENMKISISSFTDESQYNLGEEYIWCLEKMVGDYENAYDCISFKQGLFKIAQETMSRNGDHNSEISINDFKKLIQTNNQETDFREDENSAYNTITNSESYNSLYE